LFSRYTLYNYDWYITLGEGIVLAGLDCYSNTSVRMC